MEPAVNFEPAKGKLTAGFFTPNMFRPDGILLGKRETISKKSCQNRYFCVYWIPKSKRSGDGPDIGGASEEQSGLCLPVPCTAL